MESIKQYIEWSWRNAFERMEWALTPGGIIVNAAVLAILIVIAYVSTKRN